MDLKIFFYISLFFSHNLFYFIRNAHLKDKCVNAKNMERLPKYGDIRLLASRPGKDTKTQAHPLYSARVCNL